MFPIFILFFEIMSHIKPGACNTILDWWISTLVIRLTDVITKSLRGILLGYGRRLCTCATPCPVCVFTSLGSNSFPDLKPDGLRQIRVLPAAYGLYSWLHLRRTSLASEGKGTGRRQLVVSQALMLVTSRRYLHRTRICVGCIHGLATADHHQSCTRHCHRRCSRSDHLPQWSTFLIDQQREL